MGTGTTPSFNPTGSLTATGPLLIGRTAAISNLGFSGEIECFPRVLTLADGPQASGAHEAVLDGSLLPAGVYVYRLVAEGRADARTVVLRR